jgi:hypothetical protein
MRGAFLPRAFFFILMQKERLVDTARVRLCIAMQINAFNMSAQRQCHDMQL